MFLETGNGKAKTVKKKADREEILLRRLRLTGSVSLGEAMSLFNVSEATARRLFSDLEASGTVVRCYGGVRLAAQVAGYSFAQRELEYRAEKVRIGRLAASFVENGDTIYLDSGTTILQMTLALNERILRGEFETLNVVTNSIANVTSLTPGKNCRVILAGGEYSPERRDFSGPLTEGSLLPFHFTKSFLGADGLTPEMGFCSDQISISSLNALVRKHSSRCYALLTSAKFGRNSLISYALPGEIFTLVTDTAPDEKLAEAFRQVGVGICIPDRGADEWSTGSVKHGSDE